MSTVTTPRPDHAPDGRPAAAASHDRGASSSAWRLVAAREIAVRVKNKTFIISTVLTLLLLAGIGAFTAWQSYKSSSYTVAVTQTEGAQLLQAAGSSAVGGSVTITPEQVADDAAARALVQDGKADAWLHRQGEGWTLSSDGEAPTALVSALSQSVQEQALTANAAAAGTTVQDLTRGAVLNVDNLKTDAVDPLVAQLATLVFALLFYMASLMFGAQIAQSVIEEKQSRIVEIIATAIPLRQLLAGKVIGNSLIAMAQVVLYAAVGLAGLALAGNASLLSTVGPAALWFVVFFAVGFVSIAALYAVAGALSSRNEDIQSTSAPITMILVIVYIASFTLTGLGLTVASYVPIVSIIAMPSRLLRGLAQWWEPLVALGLMVAFTGLVLVLAERIYRRALLQTGSGKLSWRQGLQAQD